MAVDLGNKLEKFFVFSAEDKIVAEFVFSRTREVDLRKIFQKYPIRASILSSVIKDDALVKSFLRKKTILFELKAGLSLPIQIKYKTPNTLGSDRIAYAVGGSGFFPKQNILIIDAGTCIKCDFVSAKGEYWGGSISPGLAMRYKALNYFTQRLPLITPIETTKKSKVKSKKFIGETTE